MQNEFVIRRRVQFSETDMAGVMHFAAYYRLMEEAEHAFWRSVGLSVMTEDAGRLIGWPRRATSCEYFAPVRFEDELELALTIAELGEASVTYEVEFRCRGGRVALGRMTVVCCTTRNGEFQPIPIPDSLRRQLEGRNESS